MTNTKLIFNGISEIVGNSGMAVVMLTDAEQRRAISVVCDSAMKYQIGVRCTSGKDQLSKLLPEVLILMFADVTDISRYEIYIYDLEGGEYKTMIQNTEKHVEYPIRLSDAMLLSIIGDLSIYIRSELFDKQSSPYNGGTDRLAIPINTLDTDKLEEELQKAIKSENYRLASQINRELNRRTQDTKE